MAHRLSYPPLIKDIDGIVSRSPNEAFTMVRHAPFQIVFVTQSAYGFTKIGFIHNHFHFHFLYLQSQRRGRFEPGIPIWIIHSISLCGATARATSATTSASTTFVDSHIV